MRSSLAFALAAALLPAGAQAAEVVIAEPTGVPKQVVVERGKSARFAIEVSASGRVSCLTRRESGVRAQVDTDYNVGAGPISSSQPSGPLPFYSDRRGVLNCGVAWDGAPTPYTVIGRVTAAPGAALGDYKVPLTAAITNPGLSFLGPLRDDSTYELSVQVAAPLLPAKENDSVNLLPVSGKAYVRVPGGQAELITEPVHIPVGSRIDTRLGHVDLVSDSDGAQNPQTAEFWAGRFRVGYSRQSTPGKSGSAAAPFTELRLLGALKNRCGASGASAGEKQVQQSRRRRRRRLWGRGKGRYRTRGRRGAATVRGTTWLTQESCRGSLFRVRSGTIAVRDFGLGRTFTLGAGDSYLAAPPGVTDGRG